MGTKPGKVSSHQETQTRLTLLLEGGLFLFFGLSFIADVSSGVVLGTGKSGEQDQTSKVTAEHDSGHPLEGEKWLAVIERWLDYTVQFQCTALPFGT